MTQYGRNKRLPACTMSEPPLVQNIIPELMGCLQPALGPPLCISFVLLILNFCTSSSWTLLWSMAWPTMPRGLFLEAAKDKRKEGRFMATVFYMGELRQGS